MSVFDQTAMSRRLARSPATGPPVGTGESFDDAFRAARLADSTTSRENALEEAYARRIEAIEGFSGTRLDNPMTPESPFRAEPGRRAVERPTPARRIERREERVLEFQNAARALEVIPPSAAEMEAEALGVTREAAEAGQAAFERGSGLAAFAGTMAGIGIDPPVMASMLIGAPAATSILRAMVIESLAAAGTEAAIQPGIQARRAQAGLPAGLAEGAINVASAAAGGAVFAGLLRGGARSLRFLLDRSRAAGARTQAEIAAQVFVARMVELEEASPFQDLPKARAEHSERMSAAQEKLRDPDAPDLPEEPTVATRPEQRVNRLAPEDVGVEDVPNAVREAFDAGQALRARMAEELGGIETLRAARAVAETILAAERATGGDLRRVIKGLARGPKEPKVKRLPQFLREIGGLREFQGELTAVGARSRPGLINNKAGLALDDAALRAQEAGFFPEKPPGSGREVEVNELLDAIGEDIAGRRQAVSIDDIEARATFRAEAAAADDIGRVLEEIGIDAAKMDAEAIRARLDRIAAVPGEAEVARGAQSSRAAGLARAAEGFEDNAEVMDAALEREVRTIYGEGGGRPEPSEPRSGIDVRAASRADFERALEAERGEDEAALVDAFGEAGAREFRKLERQANSLDDAKAKRAQAKMDDMLEQITPEQERRIFGEGETGFNEDELKSIISAFDTIEDLSDLREAEIGRVLSLGLKNTALVELKRILRTGSGATSDIESFVFVRGAMAEAQRRGFDARKIIDLGLDAMRARGFSTADAGEVLGDFIQEIAEPRPATPTGARQRIAGELRSPEEIAEEAAVEAAERAAIEGEQVAEIRGSLDDTIYITEGDEIRRVSAREIFDDLEDDERFLAELEDCFTGSG